MSLLVLYLATASILLALDVVGLRLIVKPVFDRDIPTLLRPDIRYGAAAGFYLFYAFAICWLISYPALEGGSIGLVALNAAVLGLAAYGAYEFSNYATLKGWTPAMLWTDLIWGTALTAVSAVLGILIARSVL